MNGVHSRVLPLLVVGGAFRCSIARHRIVLRNILVVPNASPIRSAVSEVGASVSCDVAFAAAQVIDVDFSALFFRKGATRQYPQAEIHRPKLTIPARLPCGMRSLLALDIFSFEVASKREDAAPAKPLCSAALRSAYLRSQAIRSQAIRTLRRLLVNVA